MVSTALATFGKRSSKPCGWFEAKSTVLIPVIEAKRAALVEYKRTPSERNLQILRTAKSKAQQTARCCANEHWTELSENIQSAARTGNITGMYDGIKKSLGLCSRPHDVEKHSEPTPQDRGKEAGECTGRKKDLQKGAQQL